MVKKENKEKSKEEKKEKEISKEKLETLKSLIEFIRNNNTIIIASIKNLPSKQFQAIRKKLRGKADVIVVKKRVMLKAIDESKNKEIEKLKEYVCEDSAVLFSEEDAFALAGILAENKNPIGAKLGQIALEDIEVEEGLTELTPGPAISELGNLGIKIGVEEGKIAIKEKKVIVKKGEKISGEAASVMAKLEIKPFKIGLEPLAILDIKTGKIYIDVKIDKALGFAKKIAYHCRETIGFLLGKANANAAALEKLQTKQVIEDKIQKNQAQQENKSREDK